MSINNYALLLDNLYPTEETKYVLEELYRKPQYNVTIFLLNKEQSVTTHLPLFNIADYFNFKGVTIITSESTRQKAEAYPSTDLNIIIGENIPNYLNIKEFNLDLIDKITNEYYAKHTTNDR